MDFYIIELNDSLENLIFNDSFEEYYETGCIYIILFIFSTIIGVVACTMSEPKKEYILIKEKDTKLGVMNKV